MTTRDETVRERLFNQFSDAEDLNELIGFFLDYLKETDDIIAQVATERFKDTSEGVWLDIVGEIIGVFVRPAEEEDPGVMFTYRSVADTEDPAKGYGIDGGSTGGKYRSLYGNSTGILISDTDMLVVINAKIAANTAGASIPDIWDYIHLGFGAEVDIETSVGLVEVTLKDEAPYINNFDRRTMVEYAPVQSGTKMVIKNWQTTP